MNYNQTEREELSRGAELALMGRIAAGTEGAFEELCARYRPLVYVTAYRVINNRDDAEDLTQEVLLSIWKKASSWDSERGKLSTWVGSIARNRAIDLIRKKTRRSVLREKLENEESIDSVRVEESSRDQLLQSETYQIARRAVVELTPEQRESIELAYFEGLTQAEVAERIGIPLGTVKARIRRGVQRLRETVPQRVNA